MQVGLLHALSAVLDAVDPKAVRHVSAGFGSAQRGLGFPGVKGVQGPGGLQDDGSAVLHLHEAERGILHREDGGIPVAPVIALILLVSQLAVYRPHHHLRLVIVHHPQGQIQRVGSDVNQGAAALFLGIQEHAPGGHCPSADSVGLGIINLSQIPVLTGLLQIGGIPAITALIADGQDLSGALGCLHHGLGLRIGLRHGLLAHHMLAGFHGGDAHRRMHAVGRQDIHGLDVLLLFQHLGVIRVHPGILCAVLFPGLLGPLHDQVAESDNLKIAILLHGRKMLSIGDSAAAYDSYFQFSHFLSLLVLSCY